MSIVPTVYNPVYSGKFEDIKGDDVNSPRKTTNVASPQQRMYRHVTRGWTIPHILWPNLSQNSEPIVAEWTICHNLWLSLSHNNEPIVAMRKSDES